mmetsp:Transcript_6334/g.10093  ORF Transcript_6334/g.10093 Transcript_6334/m.10093 type:complete len:84 (-) Transcript_6334:115-366(-)
MYHTIHLLRKVFDICTSSPNVHIIYYILIWHYTAVLFLRDHFAPTVFQNWSFWKATKLDLNDQDSKWNLVFPVITKQPRICPF